MPEVELNLFQAGGTLDPDHPTYVVRAADKQLLTACQSGTFAYMLASRQIGKSTLMIRSLKVLKNQGYKTIPIDLTKIGQTDVNSWYFNLIMEIADELALGYEATETWWKQKEGLTVTNRFLTFLHDVVLATIIEPIIISIDEIDSMLDLVFKDDFFAAIRSIYNSRSKKPAYKRLTFIMLGVATPDDLIRDDKRTPFNIGQLIELNDFTKLEAQPFCGLLQQQYGKTLGQNYFEQIYEWTEGHPYLIQRLSQALAETKSPNDSNQLVDICVQQLFFNPNSLEMNIQFIQTRVRGDRYVTSMAAIYQAILTRQSITDNAELPEINRLKLYGLVVVKKGHLVVRNKLYTKIFDHKWVNTLANVPPPVGLGLPKKYTIIQELGRSGQAVVYLAEIRDNNGNQTVALKVLNLTTEAESQQLTQFQQEIRAIRQLNHPNIIKIVETGQRESGHLNQQVLFIAMEYISGGTLKARLTNRQPMTRELALSLVTQIGSALSEAHAHHIVHRNVNPNNILLKQDEPVQAVLTDFGLAVLTTDSNYLQQESKGTYHYVAPEQWEHHEVISPATDVYALACTFYEMLTGKPPYDSDIPIVLKNHHLTSPFPLLSQPEMIFNEILQKATAKTPNERYQTMNEFIQALIAAPVDEATVDEAVKIARLILMNNLSLDIALKTIEDALLIQPSHVEALRLKGEILQCKGELNLALEAYRLAYDYINDPTSLAGRDYLQILDVVAQKSWPQTRALELTTTIIDLLKTTCAQGKCQDDQLQPLWEAAIQRQKEYYYNQGMIAYQQGKPQNFTDAFNKLDEAIEKLKYIEAMSAVADLESKKETLQVDYYVTLTAYSPGQPFDFEAAKSVMNQGIETLEKLQAHDKANELKDKLKLLQINQLYQHGLSIFQEHQPYKVIELLQSVLNELDKLMASKESTALRQKLLAIIQDEIKQLQANPTTPFQTVINFYHELNQTYLKLQDCDSEHKSLWHDEQQRYLQERVQFRLKLAKQAKEAHNYSQALEHHLAIQTLMDRYPTPDFNLGVNEDELSKEISKLQIEAQYATKYQKIVTAFEKGDYKVAYDQLTKDFIAIGEHNYEDVIPMFWQSWYVLQNGKLPLSAEKVKEIEIARDLAQAEKAKAEENVASSQASLAKVELELNQSNQARESLQQNLNQTIQKLNKLGRRWFWSLISSWILAIFSGGILAHYFAILPSLIIALILFICLISLGLSVAYIVKIYYAIIRE